MLAPVCVPVYLCMHVCAPYLDVCVCTCVCTCACRGEALVLGQGEALILSPTPCPLELQPWKPGTLTDSKATEKEKKPPTAGTTKGEDSKEKKKGR